VDSTSAPKLSGTAISTASASDNAPPVFTGVAATGGGSTVKQLKKIVGMARNLAATASASGTLVGAQQTVSQSIAACSGSATGSLSYDDTAVDYYGYAIIYSMSITYTNFVADLGVDGCDTTTYNGTVSIGVTYDSLPDINGMTLTFTNLSVAYGGMTEAYNGSYGMTWDNTTGDSTFTMSVDFKDTDGLVYRVQNYTVNFDASGNVTSISGRLYDPLYGYVDIATTTTFSYTGLCYDAYYYPVPDMGVMTLTGDGTITLDANTGDCATYQLSWISGDGSMSGSQLVNW